jgi:ABC-type transporter Mla MlaB component
MTTLLALPSELTIYSLSALKPLWLDSLPKPSRSKRAPSKEASAWPVECSAVNEVDAAGIQLLLALASALQARRRTLQLVNPSGPLIAACRSLGVSSLLAAPEAIE